MTSLTPDMVRDKMLQCIRLLSGAHQQAYDAEVNAEAAEAQYSKQYDLALLRATGNLEERKAAARREAEPFEQSAFIARAEFNRIKLRLRGVESELVALQSILKSIQLEGA